MHRSTHDLHQYNVHVERLCVQLQTTSLGFVCELSTFYRWIGSSPVFLSQVGEQVLQETLSGSQSLQIGFFCTVCSVTFSCLGWCWHLEAMTWQCLCTVIPSWHFAHSHGCILSEAHFVRRTFCILLCQGDVTLGHAYLFGYICWNPIAGLSNI